MAELKYWLWLADRVRPAAAKRLLERFGAPDEVYFADGAELEAVEGVTQNELGKLEDKELEAELRILKKCRREKIRVLTLGDAEYPSRLKNIFDPPVVMYIRGSLPAMDGEAAIAVVGTRNATAYGLKTAERMGYEITRHGGLVVSGLALGIDGAAARGALRAGGITVGVLGCAIDQIYPMANKRLFEDVEKEGCIISEYPPGAKTERGNFPARNRIMSGLSLGVLVVEAPKKSGALITAEHALEQGRDVFAVPGNVDAQNSEGTNELLRDCAGLASKGWDVLGEYAGRFPEKLSRMPDEKLELEPLPQPENGANAGVSTKISVDKPETIAYIDLKEQLEGLSGDELEAVSVMSTKLMHIDDIIDLSGLPAGRALAALTMLQIKGYVQQSAGKRFSLVITKK